MKSRITSNNNVNSFTLIIFAMAMFLNQSNIIFGANISFADFFCFITLIILIFRERLQFPIAPTIFFLFLSAFLVSISVFYVPTKFHYFAGVFRTIINYIKIIIVFLYFIIGYNLIYDDVIKKAVKWYSVFSLLIGLAGTIFLVFNIKISESMFLDYRFKGLMNDPNYFSIIQVSSLVYFSRVKNIKPVNRRIAVLLIIISIIAAGSKTGIITLLCYAMFRVVEFLIKSNKNTLSLVKRSLMVVTIILLVVIFSSFIMNFINSISSITPSFSRIEDLFTDFSGAVSESGSSRNATWENAIEIIKLSPLTGIGIGTYSGISLKLFGSNQIAHNTYLQLFSEWGILLSSILFIYIFTMIFKLTFNKKMHTELNFILRDILIIFLLGSFAISLNNARMFWFFFGVIACSTVRHREKFNGGSL
ncbi:O-antigen ligase family protein [Priestia aryabhattai]